MNSDGMIYFSLIVLPAAEVVVERATGVGLSSHFIEDVV